MGKNKGYDERIDWVSISYKRLRYGFLIVIIASTAIGGIYLYTEFKEKLSLTSTPQNPQGEPKDKRFAKVVEVVGDVKVKKVNRVNWVAAREVDYLEEGDLLQTESGSSARIIFFDGSSYIVNADSLITIQKSYENSANNIRKVAVEISSGTVDLTTSQKNVEGSSFEIQVANASASFGPFSEAKAKYDNKIKQAEFSVYRGGAEVTSLANRSTMHLDALERVSVDSTSKFSEKTKLPAPPKLVEPKNPALFVTSDPRSLLVKLKWEKVPSAMSYRVRVSPSSTFTPLLINQFVRDENVYAMKIPDYGVYHWRVNSINAGGESPASDTFSFSIIQRKPDSARHELFLKLEKVIPFGNSFEVIGRADPGVIVLINDELADVKGDGSFKHFTRPFKEKGPHELVVIAKDLIGLSKSITEVVEVR